MPTSATLIKLRVNSAEQFKESVSEPANTKLYLTYGKVTGWANDAAPPSANSSVATEYEVWHNMIGGKKLLGSDICHAIPRYNWTAGTYYCAYDHLNPNLVDGSTQFYVMNSNYDVYKCISNNYSIFSIVEPKAINPASVTETSDGYIWKYMYSVASSDLLRFTTNSYIPVRSVPSDDGTLQWTVQSSAIDGAILYCAVTSNGTRYSNTSNIIVTIAGDGVSATATANINTLTNTVNSIRMTDYGIGYTYATVTISGGGGTGATAKAIISPPGGHGTSALYELGACNLILNPQLKGSEEGVLQVANDFRQISILKDPLARDGSNVFSNIAFSQAYAFKTIGNGDYVQDEIVYQGGSQTSSIFSGQVLSWDSSNGIATVINTLGTPTSAALIGANSFVSRYVSTITQRDLTIYTGQVLYVDNFTNITRSSDQTEDFKIVLKF
jgi:hypothetical protein